MSQVLDNPPISTDEMQLAGQWYQVAWEVLGYKKGLGISTKDGKKLKGRVETAVKDLDKIGDKLEPADVEHYKRHFVEMSQRMDRAADFLQDPALTKRKKTKEERERLKEGEVRGKEIMHAESQKLNLMCLEMEARAATGKNKVKKEKQVEDKQKKLTAERKKAWEEHLLACNSAITSLEELAPSEAARLGPQRDMAVNNMDSSGLADVESMTFEQLTQYEDLTTKLAIVRRQAEAAQTNASSDKSGFGKFAKRVAKRVALCEDLCELEVFQDFTIRLEQLTEDVGDYAIAAAKLTDFQQEVNTLLEAQTDLKEKYDGLEPEIYQDSGECLLKELEALGATFDYREYYSMYLRARHHATLHNFAEGLRLLNEVNDQVGPKIEQVRNDKVKWDTLADELIGRGDESGKRDVNAGKIMTLVKTYTLEEKRNAEKRTTGAVQIGTDVAATTSESTAIPIDTMPWTTKYEPEIRQEVIDINFRAMKLGDYASCIERLETLWKQKLGAGLSGEEDEWSDDPAVPQGEIQQQVLRYEATLAEDQEKYDRYIKECDDAAFLYQQLETRIDIMKSEMIGLDGKPLERDTWELSSITDEITQARYLAGEPRRIKRGNALDAGIGEGRLILARLTKQMNRLLSGSRESNSELRTLHLLEIVKAAHKRVVPPWQLAHTNAETKLDELAQFGGDDYLSRLDEFEDLEQQISGHEQTIQSYLKAFPDLAKIAKLEDAKDAALRGYEDATAEISNAFIQRVENSLQSQASVLAEAKEAFKIAVAAAEQSHKDAKSRAGAWFDDSRSKKFFEGLQQELDQALAYGQLKGNEPQTSSIGALNAGETLLKELKITMDAIREDSFSELKKLVAGIKDEIQKDGLIKKYTKNTYDVLIERYEKKIVPGLAGLSPIQAEAALNEFKTAEIDPAYRGAAEIRDIRLALPEKQRQIDELIRQQITWVNEHTPYDFPLDPPDLGSITGDYQGCVGVILRDQSPGLVRAADQRLDVIRDQRLRPTSDELSDSWPKSCAKSIEAREEQIAITAREVERVERERLFLMENDAGHYKQAKAYVKEHGGDKDFLKMMEKSNKAVMEMLSRKEYASAENELVTMKQLAADAMNSSSKKAKALQPLAIAFLQKVKAVDDALVALRASITDSVDGTSLTDDQARSANEHIPISLKKRGIVNDSFQKPLIVLDNVDALRAERRAAREEALQLVRDYKKILLEDPVLAKIRNNPFYQVAAGPLYSQLRAIEDAVVITV